MPSSLLGLPAIQTVSASRTSLSRPSRFCALTVPRLHGSAGFCSKQSQATCKATATRQLQTVVDSENYDCSEQLQLERAKLLRLLQAAAADCDNSWVVSCQPQHNQVQPDEVPCHDARLAPLQFVVHSADSSKDVPAEKRAACVQLVERQLCSKYGRQHVHVTSDAADTCPHFEVTGVSELPGGCLEGNVVFAQPGVSSSTSNASASSASMHTASASTSDSEAAPWHARSGRAAHTGSGVLTPQQQAVRAMRRLVRSVGPGYAHLKRVVLEGLAAHLVRECPHVARDDPSGLALYLLMLDYLQDLGSLPNPTSELQEDVSRAMLPRQLRRGELGLTDKDLEAWAGVAGRVYAATLQALERGDGVGLGVVRPQVGVCG